MAQVHNRPAGWKDHNLGKRAHQEGTKKKKGTKGKNKNKK